MRFRLIHASLKSMSAGKVKGDITRDFLTEEEAQSSASIN